MKHTHLVLECHLSGFYWATDDDGGGGGNWSLKNHRQRIPKKPRLRDRTDRAWFSHILRHPARKRSGSIFTTAEPTWGSEGTKVNRGWTENYSSHHIGWLTASLSVASQKQLHTHNAQVRLLQLIQPQRTQAVVVTLYWSAESNIRYNDMRSVLKPY